MNYRSRMSLDGTWQFQVDPQDRLAKEEITEWREVWVPMPWQAQFDDLRHYSGVAWYRRNFTLDEPSPASAVLHFGAVDYHTTVWLNGYKVGEHEGGYLPFEFEVAPQLTPGDNELVVKVVDSGDDHQRRSDYRFGEVPHGKQSWYGPVGGIWQSVWLELRTECHLQGLRLTPNPSTGAIVVSAPLNTPSVAEDARVRFQVFGPDGTQAAETMLDAGAQESVQLDPAAIALWSPDTPALYEVRATLLIAGRPVDQLSDTCGFRTVEARDGRIYLNGEPIYLRGALDQGYYPETIYTPPSLEFLEDQARKAKSLGLNCLRCHIKVEDPRYYEVADRLGLLIWTEIPCWAILTPDASRRVKETFRQIVARDWNHPSIFAWTLVNEDWGTDLVNNPEHRRWLAEFYHEAKELDPTRLIVDNSACPPNFHVASDLEDYHHYRAIPDHAQEWDRWVADFASRADWAWAEDYAHERRTDLPLIVSEFGNWGLPHPDAIKERGEAPWWFETGHEFGDGIVYPHGVRQRFDFWNLGRVFGDFDRFIEAHQQHMARSLAYEIASMRLQPAIGGYVITEFTDVHWECNGLLDMRRGIKRNLDDFIASNQDRVVIVRPQRWSGRPGEMLPTEIRAFDVAGPAQQGTLHWQAGLAEGTLSVPGGIVQVPLPENSPPGMLPLKACWVAEDGSALAQNQVEVAWVTPPPPAQKVKVVDDTALAQTLRQLGYTVAEGPNNDDAVLIARHYTRALRTAVQTGARLLLLASPASEQGEESVPLPAGRVIPRSGTIWQGDWATSFCWLEKAGPFSTLPGGPLLDMAYAEVMPDTVLVGLPAWVMRQHSWAGLALGWIHRPVSLLTQISYGRGQLVVTTFNLTPAVLASHAIAQTLLAGMLELVANTPPQIPLP